MSFDIASIASAIPGVVIGLTVHEYAHAFAAFKLGDTTARDSGRLTLNPLRHIDPLGFLFLIVAGFGWAKPVTFDRSRLSRPRLGEALIAAAGPISNVLLASLCSVFIRLLLFVIPYSSAGFSGALYKVLLHVVYINYGLFVFNLIPLPPLDGSHILFTMIRMPPEIESKLYRFGTLALFAVIMISNRTNVDILPISALVNTMAGGLFHLLGL